MITYLILILEIIHHSKYLQKRTSEMKNQQLLIINVSLLLNHTLAVLIVLIIPILPLRASHLLIKVESLFDPFLGNAFFWNIKFTPNLLYFFEVLTFYSINKIFLLFVTYQSPKFNGPFESCFNIFSSSIFYSNNFFN